MAVTQVLKFCLLIFSYVLGKLSCLALCFLVGAEISLEDGISNILAKEGR